MTASPIPHSSFLIPHSAASGGCRAAFTLVETAFAILAIGLGLLAFLGLGRLGLQSNKETLNDQRCAALASAIFETLREHNVYFVDLARTNEQNITSWYKLWNDVFAMDPSSPQGIPFPFVADIPTLQNQPNIIFGAVTAVYDPDEIYLSSWNPLYLIYRNGVDSSPINRETNFLKFHLEIYPDGDTLSSEPRIYTTTLSNPGGL
jgi:Tfp pilus assembly protein PilV